jgi:hypothetical protein
MSDVDQVNNADRVLNVVIYSQLFRCRPSEFRCSEAHQWCGVAAVCHQSSSVAAWSTRCSPRSCPVLWCGPTSCKNSQYLPSTTQVDVTNKCTFGYSQTTRVELRAPNGAHIFHIIFFVTLRSSFMGDTNCLLLIQSVSSPRTDHPFSSWLNW